MKGPNEETPGRVAGVSGIVLGVVLVSGIAGTSFVLGSSEERASPDFRKPAGSLPASPAPSGTPSPNRIRIPSQEEGPSTDPDRVSDQKVPSASADRTNSRDSSTRTEDKDVGQPAGTALREKVYVVRRDDTLSVLSRRFGVSVDRLAVRNGLVDVGRIYAGSSLIIPKG